MPVDEKLFKRIRETERIRRIVRCIHCGHDTDELYPINLIVSEKTWNKINEITRPESFLKLMKTERFIPELTKKFDDVELKPIDGLAFHINLSVCRDCVEKIGWKHKFFKKYINVSYATQQV